MNAASKALLQILQRLRGNAFENDGSSPVFPLASPQLPAEPFDGPKYANRENKSRNPGISNYSSGYNSQDFSPSDDYGNYDAPQVS